MPCVFPAAAVVAANASFSISIVGANSARAKKNINFLLKYSAILTVVGVHAKIRLVATNQYKQHNLYPESCVTGHWFFDMFCKYFN